MRFILLFLLITPLSVYAKDSVYQECKNRFAQKLNRGLLDQTCRCVQDEASDFGFFNKTVRKAAMLNCFNDILKKSAWDRFYQRCMDNPKQKATDFYQNYCQCTADAFVNNYLKQDIAGLHKEQIDKKPDKNIIEKYAKQCLADYRKTH